MIPHTKLIYFDLVHKICDSTHHFFFRPGFTYVLLKGKTLYGLLHLLILFFVSCVQNQLSYFSEIYLLHEQEEISRRSSNNLKYIYFTNKKK